MDLVHDLDTCALHVFLLVPTGCGAQLPEHIRLEPYEVEQLLRYLDSEATKRNMEIRATCAPQAQRIRLQQIRTRAKSEQPPGRGLAPSSKGCLAGNGIVFISATGIAFPCGYLPTPIGNIREQPLASILTTSELLSSLRDTTNLEGRCRNCEYNKCCGGCRARAFATSNNLFGEEPSCTMPSNAEPPMTNTR
ncbi:MAG: SPASM domain-containing protein [Polyangiaceae bacterium]|nr:SPASM domain-containing protein [Polyangiaceae bacterium]